MSETMWPERVEIPAAIGSGQCFEGIEPVCSAGHAGVALGLPREATFVIGRIPATWADAFIACAKAAGVELPAFRPWKAKWVTNYNDAMTPEQRPLVYAASWLYLGVPIDRDWPEAAELAARAKG